MFWCTAPFFVLTLALLPFLTSPVGVAGWIVLGAFEALSIFALFGLYDPHRFNGVGESLVELFLLATPPISFQ